MRLRLLALLLIALPFYAQQVQLPTEKRLTLSAARLIADTIEAEAKKNNWLVTFVVMDAGGHPILLHRMDGCQLGSIELATRKARAAITYKRETKAFEERIAAGAMSTLAMPGVFPSEGGVPVVIDGAIIGSVGVSGVTSAQDGQLAKAGIAALMKAAE
jgi:glc operon protein GlcG